MLAIVVLIELDTGCGSEGLEPIGANDGLGSDGK